MVLISWLGKADARINGHAVAAVHAGALDVLHDAGDEDLSPSPMASISHSLPCRYLSMRTGARCRVPMARLM